jgi:hypothetical protein
MSYYQRMREVHNPEDFEQKVEKPVSVKQQTVDPASRKSTAQVPCTGSEREKILHDVDLLKTLIKEENDRKKSGDDILGTIAIGELYDDATAKVEGELLENKAKQLRRITAKLRRRKGFRKFLKNKSTKMVPKTVDDLLKELPTDHEFMCIVDPPLRYKLLKSVKGLSTQYKASSKEDTGPLLTADFYQREQVNGHREEGNGHRGGKNKRKTRRY